MPNPITDDRIAAIKFTGSDNNNDGLLEPDETWSYTAFELVMNGLQANIGTVPAAYGNIQATHRITWVYRTIELRARP